MNNDDEWSKRGRDLIKIADESGILTPELREVFAMDWNQFTSPSEPVDVTDADRAAARRAFMNDLLPSERMIELLAQGEARARRLREEIWNHDRESDGKRKSE